MTDLRHAWRRAALALTLAGAALQAAGQSADYIAAIVNQELVTAAEVQQRMARVREDAARSRAELPPAPALRQQVLDALIDERVLVTSARESGVRVDEAEIDRAVASVATNNQLTLAQLRQRLQREGMEYAKFRSNVRDQMLVERMREREVASRIRISDAEIDTLIAQRRAATADAAELNIAQILIPVPQDASAAAVAERRARAVAALQRIKSGEDFLFVAQQVSEDGNRARGGVMGLRAADRLPDLFVDAVKGLKSGEVLPEVIRSPAGFHALKLVERREPDAFGVQQTRARHILLRLSPELPVDVAGRRLVQVKRDIAAGSRTFEAAAREMSEDGSAAQGGDLGWVSPGTFVPEFEEAIAGLTPGSISDPVVTRFGVHLIQVMDRRMVTLDTKQQRELARNILREQKYETAYAEWVRELRGRAYVELRDPPQ